LDTRDRQSEQASGGGELLPDGHRPAGLMASLSQL